MPQIDIPPLFPPSKAGCSHPEPLPQTHPPDSQKWNSSVERPRSGVNLMQLTNIGFVIAACLGALLSAVYLFKGGEFLQEVSAWPRELFYARPAAAPKPALASDPKFASALSTSLIAPPDESGDPFASARK